MPNKRLPKTHRDAQRHKRTAASERRTEKRRQTGDIHCIERKDGARKCQKSDVKIDLPRTQIDLMMEHSLAHTYHLSFYREYTLPKYALLLACERKSTKH